LLLEEWCRNGLDGQQRLQDAALEMPPMVGHAWSGVLGGDVEFFESDARLRLKRQPSLTLMDVNLTCHQADAQQLAGRLSPLVPSGKP
jgi:hypothetical protein